MDFIHGQCVCMAMDIHVLLHGTMVRDHGLRPWSGFHDIVHGLHMVGHVQYASMSVDVRKRNR